MYQGVEYIRLGTNDKFGYILATDVYSSAMDQQIEANHDYWIANL